MRSFFLEWRELCEIAIYNRPNCAPQFSAAHKKKEPWGVMKLIKAVLVLVILGMIGLAGFAYFGDLSPNQTEVRLPVVLNADK